MRLQNSVLASDGPENGPDNPPHNPPHNPWADKSGGEAKPRQAPGQDNPWGVRPPGGESQQRKNPHGKRWNGGRTPPPIPPFLRNLGQHGNSPFHIAIALAAIAVLLWLASGLYRVQPEENAVILRFGQYTETVTDPGLHYHLPWPLEDAAKENVMFERRIEIGFKGGDYDAAQEDVPEESMMLTGDANIVDLHFVVQWKVEDAKKFLFNIRMAEGTLKRVAESAMREVIGQNNLQDIITDKRADIAARSKKIMQDILNQYHSGIMTTQVLILSATVPEPVKEAYAEVTRANQEAQTKRNQALQYRNEIIPLAQGEAIRLNNEAQGYKLQIVSQAQGDAQRFLNVYQGYAAAKDVTRQRLYTETWEEVLKNNNTMIIDGGNGKAAPLSYLDLNALRNRTQEQ
ncbi:MAG: hflK [Alphaproteobacteria bacterium]|nr:hflK [Alphaproteobacteria bacterium]